MYVCGVCVRACVRACVKFHVHILHGTDKILEFSYFPAVIFRQP